MNNLALSNFFKNVRTATIRHAPEILTSVGIAGMIGTTIMAVKATPKALRLIEERKKEEHREKLPPVEVVKTTWKCYVPAVVTGVASTACLLQASSINARRNAALVTAYNLSRTALTEYKNKVVETIGESKEKSIRDHIAKDKVEADPVQNHEVILTERGTTLCYDSVFGRYFQSDRDTIQRAINKINRNIVSGEMYASLNDFYEEIGLPPTKVGYDLGWNVDDGEIEIFYSAQLAKDDTPCLVISFNIAPKYQFNYFC